MATVSYPLRQLYGNDYESAPLSVLVDPIRCARVLGLEAGESFSEKVLYVYRKQLEEAELLVINKVDLLDAAARQRLVEALRRGYPQARVVEVSCRTGEGSSAWFEAIRTGVLGQHPAMKVDYDAYADGEALLGWLNTTGEVTANEPFDGNAFLLTLAGHLRNNLATLGVETAQLKMTLAPDHGSELGAVSLTRTEADAQVTHILKSPLRHGELTINLRVEADPESLKRAVVAVVSGVLPIRVDLREINAFRPGRPNPTYRMSTSVG